MSRPGITYHDVANAAIQLLEQNIRPTVEEVRKVLKTGSHSTINRLLREWREQQGDGLVVLATADGLPSVLVSAIKSLYNTLEHEARHKYQAAEEVYVLQLDEIKKHAQQLEGQFKELFDAHEELKSSHLALNDLAEHRLAEIHSQKQTLSEQSLSLSHLQSQLEDRAAYAKKLETECQYVQANLEHYRETMRIHREEERLHYESLLSQSKHEIHELKHANQDLTNALKLAQDELAKSVLNYSVQESKLNQLIKHQSDQITELSHALQLKNTEHELLQRSIEELRAVEREKYDLCLKQRLSEQFSEQFKLYHENLTQLTQEKMGLVSELDQLKNKLFVLQTEKTEKTEKMEVL